MQGFKLPVVETLVIIGIAGAITGGLIVALIFWIV